MRKKTKARIIAENIMNVCYAVGFILLLISGSGFENATMQNYIALFVSFALIGVAVFIEKF